MSSSFEEELERVKKFLKALPDGTLECTYTGNPKFYPEIQSYYRSISDITYTEIQGKDLFFSWYVD